MDFKSMIWLGEAVLYNGKNAMVVGIDAPDIFINTGVETIKVHYKKLKKISRDGLIDIRNN